MRLARRFLDEAGKPLPGFHPNELTVANVVRPAFGAERATATAAQPKLSGALDAVGHAARVIRKAHERVTSLEAEIRRVQADCAEMIRQAETRCTAAEQRASTAERRALDQLQLAEQRLEDARARVAEAESRAAEAEQGLGQIEQHIRECFALPGAETR